MFSLQAAATVPVGGALRITAACAKGLKFSVHQEAVFVGLGTQW